MHDQFEKLKRAVEEARKLTPKEVLAISIRAGIHNEDGSLTEMYREPLYFEATCPKGPAMFPVPFVSVHSVGMSGIYTSNDNVTLIQDVYGNWIKKLPNGPTLDGLPVELWEELQNEKRNQVAVHSTNGRTTVAYYCWRCTRESVASECACGNTELPPILVEKQC